MSNLASEIPEAIQRIQAHARDGGQRRGEAVCEAVAETLVWLRHFDTDRESGSGIELVEGARAFVLETVAYISMGLGKAAISAMRGQIDLVLAYTYFCHHSQEWEHLARTGDGFQLRSAIYRYHIERSVGFKRRISMIENKSSHSLKKMYHILSAHIHGQTRMTIPQTRSLLEVVASDKYMDSLVELQRAVSISLSNFLVAVYAEEWSELPSIVVQRVKGELGERASRLFFMES